MRDTGFEPARGRIFRAREAPINLSLAEGVSRSLAPFSLGRSAEREDEDATQTSLKDLL